jgi:hypothetical protein
MAITEMAITANLALSGLGLGQTHQILMDWHTSHWQSHRISQSILQQISAKVRDGAPLFLGSGQERFMHVKAERDRDSPGLALQHPKSVIHGCFCWGG